MRHDPRRGSWGRVMRWRGVSRARGWALFACVGVAFLLGGCTVIEQELRNRGGYLDYIVDKHWMKADSKGMRALRAFAIEVSLARIASVAAKNDDDRQLFATRIGKLT